MKIKTRHKPLRQTLPVEFIYEPGNGTRFDIVMAELANGMLLVSIPNFRAAYWFHTQVSPGYVAEKLRLLPGDAEEIAKLINVQLGYDLCKRCGAITPHCLSSDSICDKCYSETLPEAEMGQAIANDKGYDIAPGEHCNGGAPEQVCGFCNGSGKSYHDTTCKACRGSGKMTAARFQEVQEETEARMLGKLQDDEKEVI